MPLAKNRKIMDEAIDVMGLHHYLIHAKRTCCEWIKKYVHFHSMNSRDDLKDGEKKIESFLTHLAVNKNVAPPTKNRALNALVFLYKKVLNKPLNEKINAVRATKKMKIPVVMTREETAKVISLMGGTPQLAVKFMSNGHFLTTRQGTDRLWWAPVTGS